MHRHILVGSFIAMIAGIIVFFIADRAGIDMHDGYAKVLSHDYIEEWESCDIDNNCTWYPEEFILVFQYEDITARKSVREQLWNAALDGDTLTIRYGYGRYSGDFITTVTGKIDR